MRFRKKPVVIEAIQLTEETFHEIKEWIGKSYAGYRELNGKRGMQISTLEGAHIADYNDWVIKGVKGEFYPCKPDIFEMTYEAEPKDPAHE